MKEIVKVKIYLNLKAGISRQRIDGCLNTVAAGIRFFFFDSFFNIALLKGAGTPMIYESNRIHIYQECYHL